MLSKFFFLITNRDDEQNLNVNTKLMTSTKYGAFVLCIDNRSGNYKELNFSNTISFFKNHSSVFT